MDQNRWMCKLQLSRCYILQRHSSQSRCLFYEVCYTARGRDDVMQSDTLLEAEMIELEYHIGSVEVFQFFSDMFQSFDSFE